MKKSSFLFLLFTVLFSAQNQRFSYEYKFVEDSTDRSKITSEIMDLDITSKGSKFYSSESKIADSILKYRSKNNPGNFDYSGIKFGKVQEVVEKIYPSFKIFMFRSLDTDTYKVEDSRKIIWTISPEKEQIGNWDTQKASTKMFGRNWTAWFSTSFPFQDGPYKFHGLPGLIVKISDNTQSHVFELKEIKNLPKNYDWKSTTEKNSYKKPVSINEEKYKKVHQNYRKDPVAGTRQMMNRSGVTIEMRDENGKVLDINKQLMEDEKNILENFIKDNNLLEIDLLK